ncbi:hypothetical protein OG252_01335 [Streptomyces sp. NBC_01352]|nr:hypothetical protein [Streptomyces sp. NBC_01373]
MAGARLLNRVTADDPTIRKTWGDGGYRKLDTETLGGGADLRLVDVVIRHRT